MFDQNSPKSHSKQHQKHKDLYKTSPNWQQIYKKQCLSRLNQRRSERRLQLIDRFRNIDINDEDIGHQKKEIVEEVMETVWHQISTDLPLNTSDMTDFMEQIRQELLIEEEEYWEQLLEWRKQEEIEWLLGNRDSVVCFFCQKNALKIESMIDNKTKLFCTKCGFNFTAQFSLSLAYIQERVDHIVGHHSSVCANPSLNFNLINDCSNNDFNNISVSCDVCFDQNIISNIS